jgi:outer membrane protein
MKRIITLLLSTGLLYAHAQVKPLTLNEAIATSLQNNYDIQLSRNDSTLAALNNSYAKYGFYPSVNANGAVTFNNTDQLQVYEDKKRTGTVKNTNVAAAVNLNWTLFDGFKMFITRKRLNELVELGELQIRSQVVGTVSDVMRTYYNIVRQEQLLHSTEEQMDLSNERLRLAKYKFEVGTGAKPDVLQAEIDLNSQKANYLAQQTAINKLKDQLNQLLNVPSGTNFTVADTSIAYNENLLLDSVQAGIVANNPSLLVAQQNMVLAGLTLQQRKAERYPTVQFNSAYVFSRTHNQSIINPVTQPFINRNAGFNYGFSATIPIFNAYNTRRNIQVAQLDLQYQQLQYERNLLTINTSVATAYKDYDLYKRALALEEENIKLVRENLFIARERYRLGVSTFLEMRTAQQSLAEANARLIEARYNTKLAEIQLMELRGDIIR